MKHAVLISLMVGVALTCTDMSAAAGDESFSADFGSAPSPLQVNTANFPFNLTLPEFNTALGTLTGVEVTLNTTDLLESQIANIGDSTSFIGAQANGTITVAGLGGTQSSATLATSPINGTIGFGQVLFSPAATGTTSDTVNIPLADFGSYEAAGGGVIDFTVDSDFNGNFSGTALPGVFFGGIASIYGSAGVDYTYSAVAVPDEQNLVSLAVLSFGGMIWYARKFKPA